MNDRNLRILVLDDSVPYLDFMRLLLTSDGFEPTTTTTVEEAVRCLAATPYDLIITDALLPGLPPFGVVDILKQHSELESLPILICTGAVREASAAAARLQEQGVEVILKPFDIDALLASITKLTQPGNPSP
jgi:DNA-binding response OmpR family regulator